ncbi:hypothetical protein LJC07_02565 [Christensenellaceae bacterium OttesenSCG-928-L17]|nr:hypothetical protein [Christensenellaceae bacterium OttesenSCG-928-L17]
MNIQRRNRSTGILIATSVLYISLLSGLTAGQIIRNNHDSTQATSESSTVDVTIQKVISVSSSPANVNLQFTPNAGQDQLKQQDITVSVATNNPTGYTLFMNTTTNNTTLEHDTTTSYNIPSTTNPKASPAALQLNTWGYSQWADSQLESPTTFYLIPPLNSQHQLKATSALGESPNTKLTFAVYLPSNKPAGTYTKNVLFTAVANYVPEPDITSVTTMQEVTRELCDNTTPGVMANLMDTRDNTYYRVKKMPDGNCWMVDNLAYDINSAPAEGKPAYNPAPLLGGTSVTTQAQYALNNNIEGQGQIPNNGTLKASYLYNWCAALGDISENCRASATYNATTNPYGAQALQTVINGTATTTATATDQPEVQGICPAPFRLPKGGPVASPANDGTNTATALSSTANEFVRLDIAMDGLGTNRYPANTYPNFTGTTTDEKDWFGTLIGYYSSSLYGQGSYGYWWSSSASNTTYAYNLYLNQSVQDVYPARSNHRDNGFAVRCLL